MNILGHLVLSPNNFEFMLGNVLYDVVRGTPWKNASDDVLRGMRCHCRIDRFTDTHRSVQQMVRHMDDSHRHYKRVILDIYIDHLLWNAGEKLRGNNPHRRVKSFWESYSIYGGYLPFGARRYLNLLRRYNVMEGYAYSEGISFALERLKDRVSPRRRHHVDIPRAMECFSAQSEDFYHLFLDFYEDLNRYIINLYGAESIL
ncbi:MAG: ACP phosphodiesterase [Fibrobacterota bacterium]